MSTASRIRKIACLALGIALLVLASTYLYRLDEGPLLLRNSGVDLGTYRMGAIVRHTFQVWNVSTKPARMLTLAPSCLCSVAKVESYRIPPLSSRSVQMEVDTSKLGPGKQFKIVQIGFEDGRVLEANIRFAISPKPRSARGP